MKWVYAFGGGSAEGRADMRNLLGGKGAGLAEMSCLGLPVPPGFTITTEVCTWFYDNGRLYPPELEAEVAAGLEALETALGARFGDADNPLLVSVRSGARVSMPGMMDTVLNLGINDDVEQILADTCGAPFGRDTHEQFRDLFRQVVGPTDGRVPADPYAQLRAAITAVFDSWNSERAVSYRRHHNLEGKVAGTSVTVQAMVFGNLDDRSGTGVLFSRNPLTGEANPFGEWLPRGQGEDVVSGKFDPLPLSALAEQHADIHRQLLEAASWLELEGTDVQDIEFTVEAGKLYLLQTRAANRSAKAAVAIAVALQREGLISISEALARVTPAQLDVLLTPVIEPSALAEATVVASGLPACPGVGAGRVVADSDSAEDAADNGEDAVLARETTSPDDVGGIIAARAVITEQGGSTSHAAVVSRELHTPCVVGCGKGSLRELVGTEVTVDGGSGTVYSGLLPLTHPSESTDPDMATLLAWAQRLSPVKVLSVGEEVADVPRVDHQDPPTVYQAINAGAATVAATHPLPVLLMILERQRNTGGGLR